MRGPRLSVILATHNRRDVLAHTLDQLAACGLGDGADEIIVVDNASTEDVAAVTHGRRGVTLLPLRRNAGSCAKVLGAARARAPVLLFLDDDSYPRPGCVERLIARMRSDPELGAAGFTVHLRDGGQECSALPHVFVGCGVGLRADAVWSVGGLDPTFFMQAEEYDLSFRLLRTGWKVEICGDLQVEHLKTPQARRQARTTYHDVRNNLRVLARYVPASHLRAYGADWRLRYRWLAAAHHHQAAYYRGLLGGTWLGLRERARYRRWRLTERELELLFSWEYVAGRMRALRTGGVKRIVLADLGKNVYAFFRAARRAGLDVLAVADDQFAHARCRRTYRGVQVLSVAEACHLDADAFVISNTSYVHAARREADLSGRTRWLVHNWFPPPVLAVRSSSAPAACLANA